MIRGSTLLNHLGSSLLKSCFDLIIDDPSVSLFDPHRMNTSTNVQLKSICMDRKKLNVN